MTELKLNLRRIRPPKQAARVRQAASDVAALDAGERRAVLVRRMLIVLLVWVAATVMLAWYLRLALGSGPDLAARLGASPWVGYLLCMLVPGIAFAVLGVAFHWFVSRDDETTRGEGPDLDEKHLGWIEKCLGYPGGFAETQHGWDQQLRLLMDLAMYASIYGGWDMLPLPRWQRDHLWKLWCEINRAGVFDKLRQEAPSLTAFSPERRQILQAMLDAPQDLRMTPIRRARRWLRQRARRWRRQPILFVLACIATAVPMPAHAELCDAGNCAGRVGYVFLPSTQNGPVPGFGVFAGTRLPKVNATIRLLQPVQLLTEPVVAARRDEFREPEPETIVLGADDFDNPEVPVGDIVAAGTRVRILSYRTFITNYGESGQLLFALVTVVGPGR